MQVNALRSKLELLCKELQKQNKLVSAESKRVGDEEDAKRKELSERFSVTIADIRSVFDLADVFWLCSLLCVLWFALV